MSLDKGQIKRREAMPGGHPWCPMAVWYNPGSTTGKAQVAAVGLCEYRPGKPEAPNAGCIVVLSLVGHEPT